MAETQPNRTEEVRLGLVLYGGVSLAVYMSGVTEEFFHAVKGRGVYSLVKALTDSDITVDVISGTSAGGINGVYLAYALANNRDFRSFTGLWRHDGDLGLLLRRPFQDPDNTRSLLDSEGYYQRVLENAFATMPPYQGRPGDIDSANEIVEERPPTVKELDLFITGTDLDGSVSTRFDDAGHAIDVKDHRTVFLLKHRAQRKRPFDPTFDPKELSLAQSERITYSALATLCRLTSGFPVAFAPIHVKYANPGDTSVDGRLQMWGSLGKACWFVDGGVLANKPFTPTLKQIFERTADREVDRILFYVEPDPERFTQDLDPKQPTLVRTGLDPLIGIPSYQSIGQDLEALAAHNTSVEQFERLCAMLSPPDVDLQWDAPGADVYRASRLLQIADRAVQGLLKKGGQTQMLKDCERKAAGALSLSFQKWVKDAAKFQKNDDPRALMVRDLDVYYPQRRLFHVTDRIMNLLSHRKRDDDNLPRHVDKRHEIAYREIWQKFNRLLSVYEILQTAMETLLDEAEIRWQSVPAPEVWSNVRAALCVLLDQGADMPVHKGQPIDAQILALRPASEFLTSKELSFNWKEPLLGDSGRKNRIVKEIALNRPLPVGNFQSLLVFLANVEDAILSHTLHGLIPLDNAEKDHVWAAYHYFFHLDLRTFPLELVGGLHEKSVVKIVRISPSDAQKGFSQCPLAEKVTGRSAGHFGAFLKRSWRSNDMLWGRLDGICQLLECLLAHDRIYERLHDPDFRRIVRANLSPWLVKIGEVLPGNSRETLSALRKWLASMVSRDEKEFEDAMEEGFYRDHLNLLIEAAQMEALGEELPKVLADAAAQEMEWNQPRSATGREKSYISDDGVHDQFAIDAEAARIAQKQMENYQQSGGNDPSPRKNGVGKFFADEYAVGSESMDDIPAVVRWDLVATALLVARNCIFTELGPRASKTKGSLLFKLMVDLPLRAFHGLVHYVKGAPQMEGVVGFTLVTFCAAALAVGILWFQPIIWDSGKIARIPLLIFIVLPGLVLGAVLIWMSRGGKGRLVRKAITFVAIALIVGWPLWPIWWGLQNWRPAFRQMAAQACPWPLGYFGARSCEIGTGIALGAWLVALLALAVAGLVSLLVRNRGPAKKDLAKTVEENSRNVDLVLLAQKYGVEQDLPAKIQDCLRNKSRCEILGLANDRSSPLGQPLDPQLRTEIANVVVRAAAKTKRLRELRSDVCP